METNTRIQGISKPSETHGFVGELPVRDPVVPSPQVRYLPGPSEASQCLTVLTNPEVRYTVYRQERLSDLIGPTGGTYGPG